MIKNMGLFNLLEFVNEIIDELGSSLTTLHALFETSKRGILLYLLFIIIVYCDFRYYYII